MKLISWNVNGLRACLNKGFDDFFIHEKPDILCLQETKAHPDQIDPRVHSIGGYHSFWSSAERKGYSGTATFLKRAPESVAHGIGIRKFDSEGRFVVTVCGDVKIFNVYFPNGSAREERHLFKQEFLARFTAYLSKLILKGEKVIVLGDYNVAYLEADVFDPIRLSRISGFLPEEREWFRQFLNQGFVDSFRFFYPQEKNRFSWWSYRENARKNNRGWRIDHICVSENLRPFLQSAAILDGQEGSDHCPVLLELEDKAFETA